MAGSRYSPMPLQDSSLAAASEREDSDGPGAGGAGAGVLAGSASGACGHSWIWRRALVSLSVLGAAVAAILLVSSTRQDAVVRLRLRPNFQGLSQLHCTENHVDMDLLTRSALPAVSGVASAQACRERCLAVGGCGAWTWGQASSAAWLSEVCFLKKLERGERPRAVPKPGVVSGLACSVDVGRSAQIASDCHMHENVDFWTKSPLRTAHGVPSAEGCSDTCSAIPGCGAWTWTRAQHNCFLKRLEPSERPTQVLKPGAVSGRPCTPQVASQQVATTAPPLFTPLGQQSAAVVTTASTIRTTTSAATFAPGTLWCFALMLPFGYEPKLLEMQMEYGQSLFACDGYDVYSNRSWMFGNGQAARVVNTSMQCKIGGEFKTALNAGIFKAVWLQVVADGTYRLYDWTVKVDPDCVFFPSRLRTLLQRHRAPAEGLYLNNCRFGLHGPLEVFSQAAVGRLAGSWEECGAFFKIKCSGDCHWGEDMYVDQCLSKVLHIKREDEFEMLSEDHCDAPKGWDECRDSTKAAFHPFKTSEGYKQCVVRAMALETSSPEPQVHDEYPSDLETGETGVYDDAVYDTVSNANRDWEYFK